MSTKPLWNAVLVQCRFAVVLIGWRDVLAAGRPLSTTTSFERCGTVLDSVNCKVRLAEIAYRVHVQGRTCMWPTLHTDCIQLERIRIAYIYPCPMWRTRCCSLATFLLWSGLRQAHRSVFEDRTVRLRVRTAFQICMYSYVVALKLSMPSSVKHVTPRGRPFPLLSPPCALIRQQLREKTRGAARAETMAALLLGPFGLLRGQGTQESQQGDAGQRPPNTACVELESTSVPVGDSS